MNRWQSTEKKTRSCKNVTTKKKRKETYKNTYKIYSEEKEKRIESRLYNIATSTSTSSAAIKKQFET